MTIAEEVRVMVSIRIARDYFGILSCCALLISLAMIAFEQDGRVSEFWTWQPRILYTSLCGMVLGVIGSVRIFWKREVFIPSIIGVVLNAGPALLMLYAEGLAKTP